MTRLLDTPERAFYKPRASWLAVALGGFIAWAGTARGEVVLGAQIPDSASKVGENRYRSSEGFEDTLKYYRSVYPPAKYPWKSIANQPGIKAMHISLAGPGKKAEGLNIYEANDEVRLYVVPADAKPVKPPPKKTAKPRKK